MRKMLTLFMQRGLNDLERRRIIEGTFQSLFIQGLSVALVFAGNLLLARWAGAGAYGGYVHVFNWISILSVVAIGGREDLVIVEITRYRLGDHPGAIAALVRATNRYIFLASLLIGLVFVVSVWLFQVKTLHEYRYEFLLASAAIYFMAFLTLNQFVLQALDHIRLSQLVEKLIKPLLMIFFLVIAHSLGFRLDSGALVLLVVLALVISCILLIWLLIRKTREFRRFTQQPPAGDGHRKKSFYFFSITLLTLLVTKIVMLILPYFSPQKDIGLFNISSRFADLIIYPFFLMHTVLPQLFAKHADSEVQYKQSLYSESTRLMLLLSLPLLILNLAAGKIFLGWFGKEFLPGYSALVLLSIAQALSSLFGPANTILMMQNKERYAAACLLVYVIVLFLSSLLLIPFTGMTGGALAMLISSLVYNIVLSVQAYRLSGIISPFFAFLVPSRR